MDPNTHRGPEKHGERSRPAPAPVPASGPAPSGSDAPARVVRLVSGGYLVTVNPVDGSEIEPCPPGERPATPEKLSRAERAAAASDAAPPLAPGASGNATALEERGEETERLVRLLSRGRSVRLTGPAGSGRTRLLDAVQAACADIAPDGVIRLSGYHRTPTDVLYALFAAAYRAPHHRPERPELLRLLAHVGAIVVLDDLEFGGAALDELLGATPECAFLFSATPDVAAPSGDAHVEEVFLGGLSRAACVRLLERVVQRPLTADEAAWAGDLWFESEGLPLRFVQAAALLRQRGRAGLDAATATGEAAPLGDAGAAEPSFGALPSVAAAASPAPLLAEGLGEAARETLRFAVALGGELPHQAHLPALTQDTHADAALGELLGCGLITPAGSHYRLAATVQEQLTAAGYDDGAAGRAHTAAQHYAWWAGHPSVTPERVAAEADAVLAAMNVLTGSRESGHPNAAVLLARTAAPAFAGALHWSAWERGLRRGQEAARRTGEVAEEAYFHHELGVLALCTGNLDRARAELEASIGLRGVLSDRSGAVAGRRALALVADRTGTFTPPVLPPLPGEEAPAANAAADADTTRVPRVTAAPPPRGTEDTAPTVVTPGATSGTATTASLAVLGATGAAASTPATGTATPATKGGGTPRGGGRRGTRRNLLAIGAGVVLAAVLGTVVTVAFTRDDPKGGQVSTERTTAPADDHERPAEPPTTGGSLPPTTSSRTPTAPPTTESAEPAPTHTAPPTTAAPTDPGTTPSDPTTGPAEPTGRPTEPTGRPTPTGKPTGEPTDPTPTGEPTDEPTDPTPTGEPTTEKPSQTASGPMSSSSAEQPPAGGGSPATTSQGGPTGDTVA